MKGENEMVIKKEQELTTQQLIGNLIKVGHKTLDLYASDGLKVLSENPDLFAHLVAWNQENGEIRDSKVALPILAIRGEKGEDGQYQENALAHLLLLDPRNLVRAVFYHRDLNGKGFGVSDGAGRALKQIVQQYLKAREAKSVWWDRTVLQHRKSMKTLYALYHVKPSDKADQILFKQNYPQGSVFEALRVLKDAKPKEAAQIITEASIPFTIAVGALGGVKKNTDLLLALMERMTGTELITNSKMLEKMGVMKNPALKAAYEKGILKAQKDKKTSTLKAGRATEVIKDEKIKAKLEKLQDAKIEDLKGMEGDWLILGDMSGSMSQAIEKAKEVAAFLSKSAKGNVYLVFFNTRPTFYDVSEKSLEQIKKQTSGIKAGGGTSIGCGLQLIFEKGLIVNGIAVVSDGGENTAPRLMEVYRQYEKKFMISPTVYLLHLDGEPDQLTGSMRDMAYEKLEVKDIDYYGLPNLAKLLRSSRYTLIDEIMQTPLLKVQEVLNRRY